MSKATRRCSCPEVRASGDDQEPLRADLDVELTIEGEHEREVRITGRVHAHPPARARLGRTAVQGRQQTVRGIRGVALPVGLGAVGGQLAVGV